MKKYPDEKLFYSLEKLNKTIQDPSFQVLFTTPSYEKRPHNSSLYRNLLMSHNMLFKRLRRPQEALVTTVSDAKYFAQFNDWDGVRQIPGTLNSFIADALESYYYIVDNSYYTLLENMDYLEIEIEENCLLNIAEEKATNNLNLILRNSVGFIFCVGLTIFVATITKAYDDVWDFYSSLEKQWILNHQKATEKFIVHVQQSKHQRKLLKNTYNVNPDQENDNNRSQLDGFVQSEDMSFEDQEKRNETSFNLNTQTNLISNRQKTPTNKNSLNSIPKDLDKKGVILGLNKKWNKGFDKNKSKVDFAEADSHPEKLNNEQNKLEFDMDERFEYFKQNHYSVRKLVFR